MMVVFSEVHVCDVPGAAVSRACGRVERSHSMNSDGIFEILVRITIIVQSIYYIN